MVSNDYWSSPWPSFQPPLTPLDMLHTQCVCVCACISVCAVFDNNPFSSWMDDTCRKSRLCKIKSGPFLHEILPRRCTYACHNACHMCFGVWSSVCITVNGGVFLKVSRPTQRCIRALEVTHGILINQLCGHVSLLGEESTTRHVKGTRHVHVSVWVCECLCVCSPAVQMFPIFKSPLAPLDVQESMSLCRTYFHVPHTDCSYIVQRNSSLHWSSFVVPHDTAVVPRWAGSV